MKYLRLFETESQYETAKVRFEYPNVSYAEDIDIVHYMEKPDYSKEYLTFEALEDGTFTLNIPANINSTYMTSVSYSVDYGETWTTTTVDNTAQTITTPTITQGNKVLWKGVGKTMGKSGTTNNYSIFSATGNFNVKGNIMSMLYGDNFLNQVAFPSGSTYNFAKLFVNSNKLISASNMILPATTLVDYCYSRMFYGCTSLTTAPELPATTLTDCCYERMFYGCTSLTIAPVLPATTLAMSCYDYMFYGCTSLTTAPELPATTLTDCCYERMFYGCTSLTIAPVLPATTLAMSCYDYMFYGCTSLTTAPSILPATTLALYCYNCMFNDCTALTTAPELPATTLASNCYNGMFMNCASLATAPELPATTLEQSCYSSMFSGCRSLTTAPVLPATTLASYCYANMFWGCTALTTAPELPATTLTDSCYKYMFYGCSNLNYIKAMFTTTPSTSYTSNWVSGVASTGTFIKNVNATWTTTGVSGVPTGWTVQTASE